MVTVGSQGAKLKYVLKMQALWRGYSARQKYKATKAAQATGKYFTEQDFKETISSQIYNPNEKRQTKPPYTYASKSVYTGEWRGGFRDGQGQ